MSNTSRITETVDNHQLYRKLNDKYYEAASDIMTLGEQLRFTLAFYCECPNQRCHERVNLSLADYRSARGIDDTSIIHKDHRSDHNKVIAHRGEYSLVTNNLS